ncbi:MAG: hypothetical protein RLZZ453_101 [Chlamydiota bacterium]
MTLSPASSLITGQYRTAYLTIQEALKKIDRYANTALSIQETTARMQGITKLHTDGIREITSEDYQGGLIKAMEAYAQRIELILFKTITARTITLLQGDSSSPLSKCIQRLFGKSNAPEGTSDINTLNTEQEKLSKLETTTADSLGALNKQLDTVRTTANIEKVRLSYEESSQILLTFTRQYDQLLSDLIASIEKVNSVFEASLIQAEIFFGKICAENRKTSPLISANQQEYERYLLLIEEKQLLASYAEKITAYCSMDFNKQMNNKSIESFPALKQQISDLDTKLKTYSKKLTDCVTTLKERGKELEDVLDKNRNAMETYLAKPQEPLPDWVEVPLESLPASLHFNEPSQAQNPNQ